ncbi:MAG: cyclic nucleotide-binding domain-containing protein [Chloroflexi bacterium]|nr:cyclic nucleotide-binding domain-containing protein [Chloroflexota bacterium]
MPDEISTVQILQQMPLFHNLSEAQMMSMAESSSRLVLSMGELIYEQGSQADSFYIILSGRVQLTRVTGQGDETLGSLDEGDYFGLETLEEEMLRQSNASALTEVILLVFDSARIKELADRYPILQKRFLLIRRSFRHFINLTFPWIAPRETIYYIGRRSGYYLIPRLILPTLITFILLPLWIYLYATLHLMIFFIITLVTALVSVGWVAWVVFDWSNDYSIITSRRVLFQEKIALIYDSRQEVPLDAILADDITTGQIGRWLDYGDLIIRTFTGALTLPGIAMPAEVKILLDNRRDRARLHAQRNKTQNIRHTIRQHIGLDEQDQAAQTAEQEVPKTIHSGTLPNALSDLFMLRTEVNGVITYRTHWFMLLGKVILPTLLLFLTLTLLILRLVNVFTLLTLSSTVLLCLLLLLTFGAWWLYQYIDWRNDRYIISDKELIDIYKRPLGVEQKRTAPLENILSIDYERPNLIHLILNFGTVFIRVGEASLTFNNVFNPSEVQREIFERLYNKKLQKQQQEDDNDQRRLAEWLEIYHQETTGQAPADDEDLDDEEEENE